MIDFQSYDAIFKRKNYPVFNKETFLPEDNQVCVCLSGKMYKDCCKKRIENAARFRQENSELADEELKNLYHRKVRKMVSYKVEDKSINKKIFLIVQRVKYFLIVTLTII